MRLLVATSNPHKLEELSAIFETASREGFPNVALLTLTDAGLDDLDEPVEDADTFAGNAEIKARYYADAAAQRGLDDLQGVLADDSGLAVDALDGAPGVRSARYAEVDGTRAERDLANNCKLLEALADVPVDQRDAAFVCVMCFVGIPQGEALIAEGRFPGRIITPDQASDADQPHLGRGANGFGYDPLFWLPARSVTSAELAPAEKNALSHRGHATRALIQTLEVTSS